MARYTRLCLAATVATLALVGAGRPLQGLDEVPAGWRAGTADDAIASVAAACAWLLICWIALAVLATVLGQLPGSAGQAGRLVARRVTPRLVRRCVEAALGLTVMGAPALAPAVAAHADTARPSAPTGLPSLDRPAGEVPPPGHLPAGAAPSPRPPAVYVVRNGECLWAIAAAHLPRGSSTETVAASWPRWYAANRSVIGADPDLLQPGQRLVPPVVAS